MPTNEEQIQTLRDALAAVRPTIVQARAQQRNTLSISLSSARAGGRRISIRAANTAMRAFNTAMEADISEQEKAIQDQIDALI